MKITKIAKVLGILAAVLVAIPAQAVPSLLGEVAKNGTGIDGGNSNNSENNFYRLVQFLESGDFDELCVPIWEGQMKAAGDPPSASQSGLTDFHYAVVHYGVGQDGESGSGGGVAFFYLGGVESFDFPSSGSGPAGFGGLSSIDYFRCSVPDGGTTLALLGLGVAGLAVARRRKA